MVIKKQCGQVALILILVITVVAGIVIAFAGRATTETKTQQIQLDTTQAMLAAESGLNYLVKSGAQSSDITTLNPGVSFSANKNDLTANQVKYQSVKPGGMILLDFGDKVVDGCGLNLLWTATGDNPGIFVQIINTNASNSRESAFVRYQGTASNGFVVSNDGSDSGYANKSSLTLKSGDLHAYVTALGSEMTMGYSTNCSLALQMSEYSSSGLVGSKDSGVRYGITLNQANKSNVPEIFVNAVFSGTSLSQTSNY